MDLQKNSLGIAHICTFFGLFVIIEVMFRILRNQESPMKDTIVVISNEDFNKRLLKGEKLVIFENLVLDVSRYQYSHPGGKFVIN